MKNKILIFLISVIFLPAFAFPSENTTDKLPYNYESTDYYIIELAPLTAISTKENIIEGEHVQYRICNDVFVKGKKILQKDDIINARISTIILPGKSGLPGELTVDKFELPNINQSQIIGEQTKKGHYKWWYMAIKFVTPPPLTFIPTGRFIKGGHAKIKQKDTVKIEYYPDWM